MEEFKHFDKVVSRMRKMFKDMSEATNNATVSRLEREGLEVMRELQFTAPRIWNDFVQASQHQRRAIASGTVEVKPKKKTTRKKA